MNHKKYSHENENQNFLGHLIIFLREGVMAPFCPVNTPTSNVPETISNLINVRELVSSDF